MRNYVLMLVLAPLAGTLSAQGVFSNNTHTVLEKVIQDYPNHFYNIKGELIGEALQTTRYRSTLQLPGSSSSTVVLVRSTHPEEAGWTCIVQESSDFGTIRTRFQEIYNQLSNSIITSGDQKTYILSGQYETPSEDRKSTRIVLSLLPGVGDMKKLKVDLYLFQEAAGTWKIALTVSDQGPKEETQGAITAN